MLHISLDQMFFPKNPITKKVGNTSIYSFKSPYKLWIETCFHSYNNLQNVFAKRYETQVSLPLP